MIRILKIIGLLACGATLCVATLYVYATMKIEDAHDGTFDYSFPTFPSGELAGLSQEEQRIWNAIRNHIRAGEYEEANELSKINKDEVTFEVLPSKERFGASEAILAEIRITNISNHPLVMHEPKITRVTPNLNRYDDYSSDDYHVKMSPMDGRWLKIVAPDDSLSMPILIDRSAKGENRISYYLANYKAINSTSGHAPTIATTKVIFTKE